MSLNNLLIWRKAIDLSMRIYQITRLFPDDERYGLISQLRRCSASVPSNIAEGEGRLTRGERRQALSQARGSLYELSMQLIIAARLGYVPRGTLRKEIAEVKRMLDAYIVNVRQGR